MAAKTVAAVGFDLSFFKFRFLSLSSRARGMMIKREKSVLNTQKLRVVRF